MAKSYSELKHENASLKQLVSELEGLIRQYAKTVDKLAEASK